MTAVELAADAGKTPLDDADERAGGGATSVDVGQPFPTGATSAVLGTDANPAPTPLGGAAEGR